jgi:hypothetical protein
MPPRSPRGRPAGTTVGMLLCRMMPVPATQHARAVDERPPARRAGGRCRREGRRAGGMVGRGGRAVRRRWQNGSARPRAPASGRRDALRFSHPPSTGLCIGLPTSRPICVWSGLCVERAVCRAGCVSSGLCVERAVCRAGCVSSAGGAKRRICRVAPARPVAPVPLFQTPRSGRSVRQPAPRRAHEPEEMDRRRMQSLVGGSRLRGRTACKQESTQAAGPPRQQAPRQQAPRQVLQHRWRHG